MHARADLPPTAAPANWRDANAAGLRHARDKAWTEAARAFSQAAQLLGHEGRDALRSTEPQARSTWGNAFALVLANLAQAEFQRGRLPTAITAAERALDVRLKTGPATAPAAIRVRSDLAVLLMSAKRIDDAAKVLDDGLQALSNGVHDDVAVQRLLEQRARITVQRKDAVDAAPRASAIRSLLARGVAATPVTAKLLEQLDTLQATLDASSPTAVVEETIALPVIEPIDAPATSARLTIETVAIEPTISASPVVPRIDGPSLPPEQLEQLMAPESAQSTSIVQPVELVSAFDIFPAAAPRVTQAPTPAVVAPIVAPREPTPAMPVAAVVSAPTPAPAAAAVAPTPVVVPAVAPAPAAPRATVMPSLEHFFDEFGRPQSGKQALVEHPEDAFDGTPRVLTQTAPAAPIPASRPIEPAPSPSPARRTIDLNDEIFGDTSFDIVVPTPAMSPAPTADIADVTNSGMGNVAAAAAPVAPTHAALDLGFVVEHGVPTQTHFDAPPPADVMLSAESAEGYSPRTAGVRDITKGSFAPDGAILLTPPMGNARIAPPIMSTRAAASTQREPLVSADPYAHATDPRVASIPTPEGQPIIERRVRERRKVIVATQPKSKFTQAAIIVALATALAAAAHFLVLPALRG